MEKQCKIITFPMKHDNILDTKGNLERRSKFLIEAIRQIAGNETVKTLTPLIIAYRVACDLNGFADGIEYMEERNAAKWEAAAGAK